MLPHATCRIRWSVKLVCKPCQVFLYRCPLTRVICPTAPTRTPLGPCGKNRLSKCWTWHKFVSATCNLQLEGSLVMTTPTSTSYLVFTFQRSHLCLQFMLPGWLTCAHQSHSDPRHLLTWFSFWCQLPRPHAPAPPTSSVLPPLSAHSQVNILMSWHATCNCSNPNSMYSHPASSLPYLTPPAFGHWQLWWTHPNTFTCCNSNNNNSNKWTTWQLERSQLESLGWFCGAHTHICMYASVSERYYCS